jgi:hypothetical protein
MPLCILMACEGSGGQCRTGAKPKLLTPGLRISIPLKPPQPLSMEMRQGSSEGCGEAARSSGIEGTFWVPPPTHTESSSVISHPTLAQQSQVSMEARLVFRVREVWPQGLEGQVVCV